jgi:hypothetical protein
VPTLPLIVGTDAGIYGSLLNQKGGFDWVTNGGLASRVVFALVLDPASATTVYAGADGGLFKSTDGAMTWTQVTNGMTATNVFALLFDPASPSTFYAGTDAGVFRSTDGGSSWTPINLGLTNLVIDALIPAPGPDGVLYAATNGGGVFFLTDELETRAPVVKPGNHRSPKNRVVPSLTPGYVMEWIGPKISATQCPLE